MTEISKERPRAAVDRTGGPVSLRWVLATVVAEYVRRNGHADLLHERIDGATGS